MLKRLLIASIVLLQSGPILSHPPYYRFEHTGNSLELPSNYVEYVAKDSSGFIWLVTLNGVARYDGHKLKIYQNDPLDTNSIKGIRFHSTAVDADKNVWFGSFLDNGASRYLPETESFKNYTLANSNISDNNIHQFYLDSKNQFWLCTGAGLSKYIPETDDFIPVATNYFINQMIEFNGNYWVAVRAGILVIDTVSLEITKTYKPYIGKQANIVGNEIKFLSIDLNGNLWACGIMGGLFKYSEKDDEFIHVPIKLENKVITETLVEIYPLERNIFLIVGQNTGLLHYNTQTGETHQFIANLTNPYGMKANTINSITATDDGIIWLPTHGNGLYKITPTTRSIIQYAPGLGAGKSLGHGHAAGLAENDNGQIAVALDGGGVNIIDTKTGKISIFSEEQGFPSNAGTDVTCDHEGNFWVSTWSGGIIKINTQGNSPKIEPVNYNPEDLQTFQNLKGIFIDSKKRIWTANHFGSTIIYDKERHNVYSKINHGKFPPELFKVDYAIDYAEDKNGNIWIGGYDKLYKYNETLGTVTEYGKRNTPSLKTDNIFQLFTDKDAALWLVTGVGILKYLPEQDSFKNYSEKYDLPPVNGMVKVNEFLWLASRKGIIRLNLFNGEKKLFDDGYDLNNYMFIEKSAYLSKTGYIYFGGTNGFIKFHPDSLKINKAPPPVAITGIEVMGVEITAGDSTNLLLTAPYATKHLELKHNQNSIKLHFAALNYLYPEKNKYKYKLINFDNDWKSIRQDKVATYTNLNPGKYIFQVIASNNDGIWNTEGATLQIDILPPFWKKVWFRLLVFAILVLLIYGYIRFRIHRFTLQNKRLEEAVELRTKEISEKNRLLKKQAEDLNESNTLLEERQQYIEEQSERLSFQTEELTSQKEFLHNQTELLKKTNTKLNESNATKDKFFSIIAHDLKNPFSVILGFSELLYLNANKWETSKIKNSANNINLAAKQTFSLLENLLNWAKSQQGNIAFKSIKLDLTTILQKAISENLSLASKKNIEISTKCSNEEFIIPGDENMIRTIFRNLLTNAIKFTPKEGEITINMADKDAAILISISDTGVGMPPDILKNIFRIDNKHTSFGTEKEGGSGLGLILCREFTEKHGGQIWAESQEGVGSTFYISLPKDLPDN